MPYIMDVQKEVLGRLPSPASHDSLVAGELNYLFTCAAIAVHQAKRPRRALYTELMRIGRDYLTAKAVRYERLNMVAGALALASLEFVRRVQVHEFDYVFQLVTVDLYDEFGVAYERTKIRENGDVYPADMIRAQ